MFFSAASFAQLTKEVGSFNELKVYDGLSVTLISSTENKVEISGESTDEVVVVNTNGILKIRMKINKIFNGHTTFVKVYFNNSIDLLDANEQSLITSKETFSQVSLDLRVQEGGEINIKTNVQKLMSKAVSGGRIEVSGIAKNQDVQVNTGGFFEGDLLKTEQTTVQVSAGGNAYINASEYVNAKVRAGGTIRIYGKPKAIDQQTVLGGTIVEQ